MGHLINRRKLGGSAFRVLAVMLGGIGNSASAMASATAACSMTASVIRYDAVSSQSLLNLRSPALVKHLPGHIPHAVAKMSDVGTLDERQMLDVTLPLALNNEAELDRRIAEIYRPGSSTFHQFITPDQFRALFAPTSDQITRETAMLASEGITVQSVSENRVLLHAQGTVADLNRVFNTELHRYRHTDGHVYFAPAYDVQAPIESRILAVVGLNNVAHYRSHLRRKDDLSANQNKQLAPLPEGSGPQGGVAPSDIATAYGIPNGATGEGQTLALFELDGYQASDISTYERQFNLPNVPLRNILSAGADGSAGQGADEVTLDIEMMVALAPKATQILVYEGPNSSQGLLDTYAKIADDNLAKQISTSWGEAETQSAASDLQSEALIFKQMVAQGQALFAAAGDSGVDDDGSQPSVDDPSSQPYVVGVGGTKLTLTATNGYGGETTWNELTAREGAGGGGTSTVWTLPTWQQGIQSNAVSRVSGSMRNVPDVSLNADPETGYAIFTGGQWAVIGGTSAAAPLWAAFNALVNQQRERAGLSAIGFTNPAIYAVGLGQRYAGSFNDIADGSTNGSGTSMRKKGFPAIAGFDSATGWGTFKGEALLQQLAVDPVNPATTAIVSLPSAQ